MIVRARARAASVRAICRVHRDGGCAASHRHGAGHGATFSERVQFPAELGEFLYFLLFRHVYIYVFSGCGDGRTYNRAIAPFRGNAIVITSPTLSLVRFSSVHSRLSRPAVSTLFGSALTAEREWESREFQVPLYVLRTQYVHTYLLCSQGVRDMRYLQPARKARRNKEATTA